MKITFGNMKIDVSKSIDISIPLHFNGPQPNAYGSAMAVSRPCRAGALIGDTRQGGSCNFEEYTLVPQCNGTHTECIGHITRERISVRDALRDVFIPALLITVTPEPAARTSEVYAIPYGEKDSVITGSAILRVVTDQAHHRAGDISALVIRTLPNSRDKLSRTYSGEPSPPYLTNDAVQLMVEQGFQHLLVDIPSVDRMYDDGNLSNHRIFWNIEPGGFDTTEASRANATITELIYVPDELTDGHYLLNLQIAPFVADASPSRPLLFRIEA